MNYVLKNATRNSQFDFSLIKLKKFEFPHQQTTWMMLTCVAWLVSPNLLSKFEVEELDFTSACAIANFLAIKVSYLRFFLVKLVPTFRGISGRLVKQWDFSQIQCSSS